jgi:hypothetical protein
MEQIVDWNSKNKAWEMVNERCIEQHSVTEAMYAQWIIVDQDIVNRLWLHTPHTRLQTQKRRTDIQRLIIEHRPS